MSNSRPLKNPVKNRPGIWRGLGLCFLLFWGQTAPMLANPTGGSVAAGKASIGTSGSTETISQTSRNAIINWQTFSINSGETTKFLVPNSASATLNRVMGGNASAIYGSLQSNGKIILINPNGILIGPGGRIDTASFLGSTLDVTDSDFLKNGNLHFLGTGGRIENDGAITASSGDVYLLAPQVTNTGTITATKGTVGLAAATDVLLQEKGDQHLFIQPGTASATRATGVTQSGTILSATAELKAAGGNAYALAINNSGAINATGYKKVGGQVYLTADTGEIANTGSIRATSGQRGGKINLASVSGAIINSGTLDVSATGAGMRGGSILLKSKGGTVANTSAGQLVAHGGTGGQGGEIEMSGGGVQALGLIDTTAVDGRIGMFTIDPATFTVAASGGDETGAQVASTLATTDVTLNADNTVTINDGITWTSTNTLTLSTNDSGSTIAINAPISGVHGSLTLDTAGTGGQISATGAVTVSNFDLEAGRWSQDTSSLPTFTVSNNFAVQAGATFLRAAGGSGTTNSPYQITDIYGLQGLGSTALLGSSAELTANIDASGTSAWNGGAGFVPIGTSANPFTGTLNGQGNIIDNLTIVQSTGQFVGLFGYAGTGSTIENVGVENANILGNYHVGALAGEGDGLIQNCYSTGAVGGSTGANAIGGLVGSNGGTIETSYSGAAVTAVGTSDQIVGGLVGINFNGTIENSYSYGAVTSAAGTSSVGGLVADNFGGAITNSYASGAVVGGSGSTDVGGLIGSNSGGTVNGNFWDEDTTGAASGVGSDSTPNTTAGVTGETTAALLRESTYTAAGWNIGTDLGADTWVIFDGSTRPLLAMEYSTTITNGHQLQLAGLNGTTLTANYALGSNVDLMGTQSAADVWGTSVFNGGAGFVPIGTYNGNDSDATGIVYHGVFNGNNFTVNNLYIDRPSSNYIGLFGDSGQNTTIENLNLTNVNVTGAEYTGGLSAVDDSTFYNDSVAGSVTGSFYTGGLIGIAFGSVNTSYSTGTVNGVANGGAVGGLIGEVQGGTVDLCYSTSAVSAGTSNNVGGLIGFSTAAISNSFSTGNVNGGADVGGLIGDIGSGTLATSYTASHVTGTSAVGGLAGVNGGTITQSFWDTSTAGVTQGVSNDPTDANVIGATTAQLMSESYILSHAPSWNFTTVWTTNNDTTLPELQGLGGPGGAPVGAGTGTTDTLSGTIYIDPAGTTAADDVTLDFIFDGMLLGTTTSNGSGGYTFNVNSNDLTGGLLITDAADQGNTYYQANAPAATITGVNVYGFTLSALADVASNTALRTAAGSLTGDGINYAVTGSNLTTKAGVGMSVVANYTLDGNVVSSGAFTTATGSTLLGGTAATVTGNSVLLEGSFNRTAATTFTSTAGGIDLESVGTTGAPATAQGLTLTSAQNVTIDNSFINFTGGNLSITGAGTASSTTELGLLDGVDLVNSVVNAEGGTITVSGAGGYGFDANAGGIVAGIGLYFSGTELQTTGSGGVSLTGSFAHNVTSTDGLTALEITGEGNRISTASGAISITGNVTSGSATGDGANASVKGAVIKAGATVEATGTGGSISVTGNASGGSSIDTGADFSLSDGVQIGGSTISAAGNGSVVITGTAPTIDTSSSTGAGGNQPTSVGVYILNGTTLTATGTTDAITVSGTGGAILTSGDFTGDSLGIYFADSAVQMANGGALTLTGHGGAVNAGVGQNAADATSVGVQLDDTDVTVASGSITMTGFGGALDASQAGTLAGNVGAVSRGILIFDSTDVDGSGTTPITMTGTGGNITVGSTLTGGSIGVDFGGNVQGTNTIVSSGGALTLTGTAGTAPALGDGVLFNAFDGGELDISSASGLTITGTGGAGYSGDGTIEGNAVPNFGVAILDNVHLTSSGALSIVGHAGANSQAVDVEELGDGNVFDSSPVAPDVNAAGGLSVTGIGAGINYGGTADSNDAATFTTPGSSDSTILNAGGPYVLNGGNYTLDGTNISLSTGSAIGALDVTSTGGITLGAVHAASVTLDADSESDITQTGALNTATLTVTDAGDVILANTGNRIATLEDISSEGDINIYTASGLTVAGPVSGFGDILIQAVGGNLVLGSGAQISDFAEEDNALVTAVQPDSLQNGRNVTLVTNRNIINNSALGGNVIQVGNGANYDLYTSNPSGTELGGIPVDFTQYNAKYPNTNPPAGNGLFYSSAENGTGGTTTPPGTLSGGGTPIPPAVVPQNGEIAPQQPSNGVNLTSTDPSQNPGYSTTENGIFTQTDANSTDLANFYGGSGQVGAGDAAQLNDGELNNVSDPAAATTLDDALSAQVRTTLQSALGDLNFVEDSNTPDQGAAVGDGREQIIGSDDVVEIGQGHVKRIPADQAPQPLKDALGNGVMNGLRPGAGR